MYKNVACFNLGYMTSVSLYFILQDDPVLRFAGVLPIIINLFVILYHAGVTDDSGKG